MFRTTKFYDGNADLVNDIYLKKKIIKKFYNMVPKPFKYRHRMLKSEQDIKYLESKADGDLLYYLNYIGCNYYLIFITIDNKEICVCINKTSIISINKSDKNKSRSKSREININNIKIYKLFFRIASSAYNGTIIEGKIVKNRRKTQFIITDLLYLEGVPHLDKYIEMKMQIIENYMISNSTYNNDNNGPFVIKLNKYYNDCSILDKVYDELINSDKMLPSDGLIFLQKNSGVKIVVLSSNKSKYNNNTKKKQELPQIKKPVKKKEEVILLMRVSGKPDIYNLYCRKKRYIRGKEIYSTIFCGVASMRGITRSHYFYNYFKENEETSCLVKCVYKRDFNKWEPELKIIKNKDISLKDEMII